MATIDEILETLRNEDQPYPARIDALEDLLGFEDPRVVEAILQALASAERYLRRKAAEVLVRFESPPVIDGLSRAATSDSDEAVRRNAVRSLAQFTDRSAMDALYRAAKDESQVVSKEAEKAIEKVRGARVEGVKERLREQVESIRSSTASPPVSAAACARDVAATTSAPVPAPPAELPPVERPRRAPRRRAPEPTPAARPQEPSAPAPVPTAPPPQSVPAPSPTQAKGYVPPGLARIPALRGLSASEELGWPDLLNAFALGRRFSNMLLSALALALTLGAYVGLGSLVNMQAPWPFLAGVQGPELLWSGVALSAWLILSAFGFMISRSAAVEIATGAPPPMMAVYGFWLRRLSYPYRPALVGAILLAIPAGLIYLAGYLSTHAVLGQLIGAVAYALCLFGGGLLVFVALGLGLGAPMMVPAMVVENTGCSDAVASSWVFVFSRPWRYALYWLASTAHGLFVLAVAIASVCVAELGLGFASGKPVVETLRGMAATGLTPLAIVHAVMLFLLASYALSHYFTSRVGVYLLMRKAVDGVDLDTIHLPKSRTESPRHEPVPVAKQKPEEREQTGVSP